MTLAEEASQGDDYWGDLPALWTVSRELEFPPKEAANEGRFWDLLFQPPHGAPSAQDLAIGPEDLSKIKLSGSRIQ
jgi:hypothetical protein